MKELLDYLLSHFHERIRAGRSATVAKLRQDGQGGGQMVADFAHEAFAAAGKECGAKHGGNGDQEAGDGRF